MNKELPKSVTKDVDQFRITMYRNDDGEGESEIYVHIDLEYIGPNDSIKILHCDPVIVGTIIDRDSISIDDEIVSISSESLADTEMQLNKGVVYKYLFMPDELVEYDENKSYESLDLSAGNYLVRITPTFELRDYHQFFLELNIVVD